MARLNSDSGWKLASRSAAADQQALAWVKWNPLHRFIEDETTAMTAAEMQVQANLVNFDFNGVDATEIGTYTGNSGADDQVVLDDAATIQGLLDLLNGIELANNHLIAGLGDFRPAFVISTGDAIARSSTNIALGRHHEGLSILADSSGLGTANLFSLGLGTARAREGAGQQIPDLREAEYTSTTAGVITKVRNPALSREKHPFTTKFTTRLTRIHCGQTYAGNDNVVTVYDEDSNVLFSEVLGAATSLDAAAEYSIDNPIAEAEGPLFVEATGSSTLTDGTMSITGYIRIG